MEISDYESKSMDNLHWNLDWAWGWNTRLWTLCRKAYEVLPYGLHWEALDEDLSFEGFFNKKEHTALYRFFMEHPELNASAIARRLGISQSLFAQYISGNKHPSAEREKQIAEQIRHIGAELMAVSL